MNPVSVSYRYIGTWYRGFWGYRFEYSPNRYQYIGIGIGISVSVELYTIVTTELIVVVHTYV